MTEITRWNKDYPCSEKEYNELRDVDRVQLDVKETLRGRRAMGIPKIQNSKKSQGIGYPQNPYFFSR